MNLYQKIKKNPKQTLSFIGSGACAAAVHTSVMYSLMCLSFNSHISFTFGFFSGVLFRFLIDRNFVFLQKKGDVKQQFPRYVIACMVNYIISEFLFFVFLEILQINSSVSFILAVVLTTISGYKFISCSLDVTGNKAK